MTCASITELAARNAEEHLGGHLADCPRCRALAKRLADERKDGVDLETDRGMVTGRQRGPATQPSAHSPAAGGVWTFWAPRSEEYLVGAVLETAETELLLVPILATTDWAVDADISLQIDVLGYEALVPIWAGDRVLVEQAVEPVGMLSEKQMTALGEAYSAWTAGEPVADPAGPPIAGSSDPRTDAQAARADDLAVFYEPWVQLHRADELGPVVAARREELGIDAGAWADELDVETRSWLTFEHGDGDPSATIPVKALGRALDELELLASRRVLELAGESVRKNHEDAAGATGAVKARRRRGVRQKGRRDPEAAEAAAQSYMAELAKELGL